MRSNAKGRCDAAHEIPPIGAAGRCRRSGATIRLRGADARGVPDARAVSQSARSSGSAPRRRPRRRRDHPTHRARIPSSQATACRTPELRRRPYLRQDRTRRHTLRSSRHGRRVSKAGPAGSCRATPDARRGENVRSRSEPSEASEQDRRIARAGGLRREVGLLLHGPLSGEREDGARPGTLPLLVEGESALRPPLRRMGAGHHRVSRQEQQCPGRLERDRPGARAGQGAAG